MHVQLHQKTLITYLQFGGQDLPAFNAHTHLRVSSWICRTTNSVLSTFLTFDRSYSQQISQDLVTDTETYGVKVRYTQGNLVLLPSFDLGICW